MSGRMRRACYRLAFAWLWLVGGCTSTSQVCQSNVNCPADQACVAGTCTLRECISNESCAVGEHCDTTVGQCTPGCLNDNDCLYGSLCEAGSCVSKPCKSTGTDCDVGEFCDTSTGTCFKAAGPYCQPCTDSSECGGGDNSCRTVGGTGPYCLVSCANGEQCPAGYTCAAFTVYNEVYTYYCYALCGYIQDAQSAKTQNTKPMSSRAR